MTTDTDFFNRTETNHAEQTAVHQAALSGAKKLVERAGGAIERDLNDGLVQFVSPTYPNAKYLVKKGSLVKEIHQGGGAYNSSRDGDTYAKFASSILTTDDPDVIEWCMAHTGSKTLHEEYHGSVKEARACGVPVGLCMPEGPNVGAWAKLKELSINTATHDVQIPPEIDIDAMLRNLQPSESGESLGNDLRARAKANLDAQRRRNEA